MRASSSVWPTDGKGSLKNYDPANTMGYEDKRAAKKKLQADLDALGALQDVLFASARYGMLVVLQGMDTAGKDSAIKHVMSGLNPQGVSVFAFKEPTEDELRHDYLWRAARALPARGRIGIFNRSYYEDVVVVRVHPDTLPAGLRASERLWKQRYRHINEFERYLVENHIPVAKFYFNLSREEQAKRLLVRLEKPDKHWKFSLSDMQQRKFWRQYMRVYEEAFNATSTPWAPWYVVPADHKWVAHLAIADVLVRRLRALKLKYPRLPPDLRTKLRLYEREIRTE